MINHCTTRPPFPNINICMVGGISRLSDTLLHHYSPNMKPDKLTAILLKWASCA